MSAREEFRIEIKLPGGMWYSLGVTLFSRDEAEQALSFTSREWDNARIVSRTVSDWAAV